jgi:SpoVK/Ycf46/Vps4 family AAA+-type ATPase
MRKALKLSEAISPCVLWIDEIEKAFAGVGSDGGNEVTTRLFGQFLTWMQEKENTVFIVATANDISRMPPEFMRKGRFDELFFVDLPNGEERRKIIDIHLKKRKKWNKGIDSIALIKETNGFNGADIEAVVKDTIEAAFINGKDTITTEDLIKSVKDTKSISNTLKDKIKQIKDTIEKIDIKPASREDTNKST